MGAVAKKTRVRKPIPSPEDISADAYSLLKVAATALKEFVEVEDLLRTLPSKPAMLVQSRDVAWKRFYSKMKKSGVFKKKRAASSEAVHKANRAKGEALAALTKQKNKHPDTHPDVKVAQAAFDEAIKNLKSVVAAEKKAKKH